MIAIALAATVLGLAAVAGWRVWSLTRDVASLDRELGQLQDRVMKAERGREEFIRRVDQRQRTTDVATSQLAGHIHALRQRADRVEPWVKYLSEVAATDQRVT